MMNIRLGFLIPILASQSILNFGCIPVGTRTIVSIEIQPKVLTGQVEIESDEQDYRALTEIIVDAVVRATNRYGFEDYSGYEDDYTREAVARVLATDKCRRHILHLMKARGRGPKDGKSIGINCGIFIDYCEDLVVVIFEEDQRPSVFLRVVASEVEEALRNAIPCIQYRVTAETAARLFLDP